MFVKRVMGRRIKLGRAATWDTCSMLATVVTFMAASALLIVLPGPDNALVVRNSLRHGRATGLRTAAGTLTGVLVWVVAAAFGLSALLRASEVGYDVLRFGGASYLIWLGVSSLRSRGRTSLGGNRKQRPAPDGVGRAGYLMGVVTNLTNPKTGVFFIAFFPAFIPQGSSVEVTSLLFGGLFALEAAAWFGVLLLGVSRLTAWLHRPAIQRRIEQVTGVVLIGFAIRLATEHR
jgi:threonine/homoserine/homoserine lactone efflux protein